MKLTQKHKPDPVQNRGEHFSMPQAKQEHKRPTGLVKQKIIADDLRALVGIMTITFGAAAIGIIFGANSSADWYVSLIKPTWTPPENVYAPVWTLLYLLMGFAAWRVYRKRKTHDIRPAMLFYHLQLLFNVLWCVFFFGLRNPALALADAMILQLFIISSAASFFQVDRPAAAMLIPYMSWVAFAICLNCFIWVAN
ncbi:MAG: tryptophan-rich sensory protein [Candidatus Obscuribacterales bacterium]|jgi:tryptophan-rich sensory protein|nr:tryptophan-rich sensory protein [Candidatus Obscuribacterales bacterium]